MRLSGLVVVSAALLLLGCSGGGSKSKDNAQDRLFALINDYYESTHGHALERSGQIEKAATGHAHDLCYGIQYTYSRTYKYPGGSSSPEQRIQDQGYSGFTFVDDDGVHVSPSTSEQQVFNTLQGMGLFNNASATKIGVGRYYCPG